MTDKKKSRRGRGEGTIIQRPNSGSWYAQASGPNGRETVSGKTKTEVQKKLRAIQSQQDTESPKVKTEMTCGAFFTHWLKNVVEAGEASGATHASYSRNIRIWITPKIGSIPINRLSEECCSDVLANMREQNMSAASRQLVRGILKSALNHAVAKKLILTNPANNTASSRPGATEYTTYNAEQAKRFIELCNAERLGIVWQTGIQTGMRIGELLSLKLADLDLKAATIQVQRTQSIVNGQIVIKQPKTKSGKRTITIGKQLAKQLKAWLVLRAAEGNSESEWLFCNPDGSMLDRKGEPRNSFRRLMKKGLPRIRMHDMRHTHATLLLADGENAKVVSERLGHSSVKITLETYCHVSQSMRDGAASRLDRLLG